MDWSNIRTIAQFDSKEYVTTSTHSSESPINNEDKNDDFCKSAHYGKSLTNLKEANKPTTSISLLIESLIQLLCLVLENDPQLAQQAYNNICEEISKINLIDNSYSLKEFEEVRSQYQMQIYKIICAVRGQNKPHKLLSNTNSSSIETDKSELVETCWSRYHREFDEIGFIAGGGFGKVFKARHKLDGIEYAIKQIKIHSTTIKLCHLAEVKTIASLNHPNIVQYKAAWLEPFLPKKKSNNQGTYHKLLSPQLQISDSEVILPSSEESDDEKSPLVTVETTTTKSENESSSFIKFEKSYNHNENNKNSIKNTKELVTDNQQLTNRNQKAIRKFPCDNHRLTVMNYRHFRASKPKLAILYIQMSLCQLTLRRWLNERNICKTFEDYYLQFFDKQKKTVTFHHLDIANDIFCQILSGLNYIHSRNIVHHDIKPSNIFIGIENESKLIVQLGDFGLACPLQNAHRGIALGTPLYAAPEQLNGECNPKSDVYSLGIVLLELLLKFNTDMERVNVIESARRGVMPVELSNQSKQLLRNLLSNEKIRPNTKELTEVVHVINLEQKCPINISKIDVKLKDVKIAELKEELKASYNKNVENEVEISNLLIEIDIRDKKIENLAKIIIQKNDEIFKLRKKLNLDILKKKKYDDYS